MGAFVVFVYGDPRYYARFGFSKQMAHRFIPPYRLKYPDGWQALQLNSDFDSNESGQIICVDSLNEPDLW